jgi:hypothetical protein
MDGGQTWTPFHVIETSSSSGNTDQLQLALPVEFAQNLNRLAIEITVLNDSAGYELLVDSIFITYEKARAAELEILNKHPEATGRDELPLITTQEPQFELKSKEVGTGSLQGIVSQIQGVVSDQEAPSDRVETTLRQDGVIVDNLPNTTTWRDIDVQNNDIWDIAIVLPQQLDSGRYTLEVTLIDDQGSAQSITQDFLWGVLALNPDQDSYQPGDSGSVSMTVLDESGRTVCDAALELQVRHEDAIVDQLSTTDGSITVNNQCAFYNNRILPDYETELTYSEVGIYELTLTAVTANGRYTIVDTVTVTDSAPFQIKRTAPTRVFPIYDYTVQITVSARDAFSGTITERIPLSFELSSDGPQPDRLAQLDGMQQLQWDRSIVAGGEIVLSYRVDIPDISPEFYLLGPLGLQTAENELVHQEMRQWQIAGDALDIYRVTTYEIEPGTFTGNQYTLTLNHNLVQDYFVLVHGPSSATGNRGVDEDQVRVDGDPHANFSATTSANQIRLTRFSTTNDWVGSLSVVECLLDCDTGGFRLSEVVEYSMPAGTANTLQTTTTTLSSPHTTNTVPFGGHDGGGITSSANSNNDYSVTAGIKISKTGSNQLRFDRYGAEGRTPGASTLTIYVVEWGTAWSVQTANVTGTNSGTGLTVSSHYNTASISSVVRDNTFVWGNGYTRDDGLGDGALGQVITLGNGAVQATTETLVAVGGEIGLISPGRDFQVYVLEHPDLVVDYRFLPRGDQGSGSGYQELDYPIDGAVGSEIYDNASTTIRYTEGYRLPLLTTTSGGNGQAYSRTGAWGRRITNDTNFKLWRQYAGQPVTAWKIIPDFANVTLGISETTQNHFRWRDDSTDLDTSGGWLSAEDTSPSSVDKLTTTRLRFSVANQGDGAELSARQYQLQFADIGSSSDCTTAGSWTAVGASATDAITMSATTHIDPDGEATSAGLLANSEGYTYVNGEGRKTTDTTNSIGPLVSNYYTELEYAIELTEDSVGERNYCLRLYDAANAVELEAYTDFPIITPTTTTITDNILGEANTFSSAINGGWTSVAFANTYTSPVVVGVTNARSGNPAMVFEVDNVTSTGADMRICESEGSTANGCANHASETVGYMVIDAAVAATVDGIEAGTFTASGEADSNSVTTNYSESFSTTPLVFSNVNTVNSTEFPIEVVISATSTTSFTAGICDHLQGSNDSCDGTHGNETVGWVAIEPGNEPFTVPFDSGSQSIQTASDTWQSISFALTFDAPPVMLMASQTDNGAQDVEIDEVRSVTTNGAEIHFCEIDTADTCDTHAADTAAWLAIEAAELAQSLQLDQDGYRVYAGRNNLTPDTPLADENTKALNVDDTDEVRIRMAIQDGNYLVAPGDVALTLQYVEATDCSVATGWSDVGNQGSGAIWRGNNEGGGGVNDGATIPSSLLDGGTNVLMSFEEENDSVTNPNGLTPGQRGEWDWAIENNGATPLTNYCFRVVTSDGDPIQYTRYPEITTASAEANLDPDDPTNLAQTKTNENAITVGDYTNETTVRFEADVSDQNTADILRLCVEVQPVGVPFTDTATACGATVAYGGSALQAEVSVASLTNGNRYHWQAYVEDAVGATSAWVSFGGNSETESDFWVDTDPIPTIVYDGSTVGVDIDFNNGNLDTVSANWVDSSGDLPAGLPGLVLWLDGADVNANGTNPANGDPVSTWFDKSGVGNDIGGTGDATYDSAEQAVAFSDDVQPFDDTYDRSGGNANSMSVFSVVTGNGTTSNHVWFETTTPRVAPAENGLLGGGTALTSNNLWSSHITSRQQFSLIYDDTSGQSTAYLDQIEEYNFTESQSFANTQRLVIGDDTTGGNRLETGEFMHELLIFNEDLTVNQRIEVEQYLACKWDLATCGASPLALYEYSIGTAPGATDILAWTANGTATSFTASGLALNTTQPYYVNIRATDEAGNQSINSSDGFFVSPTLSFSSSPGSVSFDNLNVSNSYTSTKTTTLTTSTNAYRGYEIRAFLTGLPVSELSDTVPLFNGGTYAAPDEWQTGDIGYGYTSNDNDIAGSNIFNNSPCPGGGAPPCYAPFSQIPPGDIVADHTSLVSGTPVTNENFILTHRVTVDPAQPPGTYQTTIVYTVTARY